MAFVLVTRLVSLLFWSIYASHTFPSRFFDQIKLSHLVVFYILFPLPGLSTLLLCLLSFFSFYSFNITSSGKLPMASFFNKSSLQNYFLLLHLIYFHHSTWQKPELYITDLFAWLKISPTRLYADDILITLTMSKTQPDIFHL